jgi:dihydropteroate synthase
MKRNDDIPALGVRPLIMGILNATPDSFSGDGLWTGKERHEAALAQAARMIEEGADILDIGGESTRPGAAPVSIEEEIARTAPLLKELHARFPDTPLSIDTMKPDVAEAALEAGARLINDVAGDAQGREMLRLAAKHNAYLVLMHNGADTAKIATSPRIGGEYKANLPHVIPAKAGIPFPSFGFFKKSFYKMGKDCDIVSRIPESLSFQKKRAFAAGVPANRLILDPGLGFGKTLEENLALVRAIPKIMGLGAPILIGASRKSFIGRILDAEPQDRLEGTLAITAIAAFLGASIIRVHDVRANARCAKVAAAARRC